MNIALWLERAGLSHGDRPAIGHGTRVVRSYGELAQRAARLAGALRTQCGLAPGERVAIFAKNSPEYMEALYAIWTAGLAAVPVNAKLHGRELAYILEHSGARVCFVSADLEAAASAHAPASLQRLDHHRLSASTRRCSRAMRSPLCRAAAMTLPGCSTPPAPPAGRRERC